jgi:hypothetical protein
MPAGLTVSTLASLVVQVPPVTGAPPGPVTVSGNVSPARRMARVVVTCNAPEGAVGVDELLPQPANRKASPAIAVATRRDVTSRL